MDLLNSYDSSDSSSPLPRTATTASATPSATTSTIPPRTKVVPAPAIYMWFGRGSKAVKLRFKLDTANEAPRSIISYATWDQFLRPLGCDLQPVPAGDFSSSTCMKEALTYKGLQPLDWHLSEPQPGDTPPLAGSLAVTKEHVDFESLGITCYVLSHIHNSKMPPQSGQSADSLGMPDVQRVAGGAVYGKAKYGESARPLSEIFPLKTKGTLAALVLIAIISAYGIAETQHRRASKKREEAQHM